MQADDTTICLGMIVKNEAHVIGRCLASVRPFIDAWAVVDTGSTDGTQAIVREMLADLPGELIERPWVDFSHNRNESLDLARRYGRYTFIIDADEILAVDPGFARPELTADSYDFEMQVGATRFHRKQLVSNARPWRFKGVLHEYLTCPEAQTVGFLTGAHTIGIHDGARSRDPLTYRRDALLLERALLDDPDEPRNIFYLAQSYRDAGDLDQAIRYYRRRAAMTTGWSEEAWFSLHQVAVLRERRGDPWPEVMADHLTAHLRGPHRAEPLYHVAMHYQKAREYHTAQIFFREARRIPLPPATRLFVQRPVYDYLTEMEYGVSLYYTGDHAEAVAVADGLLARGGLPEAIAAQVARNREFSVQRLPRVIRA